MSAKDGQTWNAVELRRQAETRLREKMGLPAATEPLDEEATLRLLYELEVHQIELEMQNEALAEAQLATKESLRISTELFDSAPIGYFNLGIDGTILAVNLEGARLTGMQRDRLVGCRFGILVAEPDRGDFSNFLDSIFRGASPLSCEIALSRDGNERIYVHLMGTLSADGSETRTTVLDITARRQFEKSLAESHALLENLAERVPGVIYQFRLYPDGHSSFPYSSVGMCDIYEVTPEEVREDAAPVFARLHPEDHDRVAAAILESASTLNLFCCEFRVVLPRQGLRWRLCEARPQRMEDGDTLWHGIITDITPQREAEAERNRLREKLTQSQKLETVGRLTGVVAHDFNNMLGVIIGQAEMSLGRCEPDQPLYNSLTEILGAANRSADLTRQLLDFAGKQVVIPSILDLNAFVSDLLKMLRRLIGETIQLDWRPADNLWMTKVDPSQMGQILLNLCVNAKDAISGTGEIRIETNNRTLGAEFGVHRAHCVPGDYVMLSVSDNGCGMDQDTMSHVFEPFFTTKRLGRGTGLGLATVSGAVNQNHGYIGVDSAPEKGTTFTLYLPRHDGPAGLAKPEREVKAPMYGAETVLVVEDEPALLKLTTMLLEKLGYTVLPAGSSAQALQWARECGGQIQLLLTDVVMPEMNGRELAEELLSLVPHLRCLYMSGYPAEVITQNGVLPDGVSFIQKPFTIGALAAKVREVLRSTANEADGKGT